MADFLPLGFEMDKALHYMQESGISSIILTSPENIFYATGYPLIPSAGNPILHTLANQFPVALCIDSKGRTMLACWLVSTLGAQFGVDDLLLYLDRSGAEIELRKIVDHVAGQVYDGALVKSGIGDAGEDGVDTGAMRSEGKMTGDAGEDGVGAGGVRIGGIQTGGAKIGIESTCPYYLISMLEAFGITTSRLAEIDDLMLDLRTVKSAREIFALEESIHIVEQAVLELFGVLHVGMSRLELIKIAKEIMAGHGASGISHVTVSFGRENPEVAIDEILEPDRLVTLDLGAFYNGYASDNRRYAYTGRPPRELLDTQQLMVAIVDQVGRFLMPGVTEGEVFQLAVDLFGEHGLDPFFDHVGHHIGLQTEERWILRESKRVLQPGMVINVELYTPVEGIDFVGNEETFVIEKGGSRRISRLSRDIVLLGA